MMALYEEPEDKGITKGEIIASIEKDLKVEKFPEMLIDFALSRLKQKRFIESVHGKSGDLYFLTQDNRTKFKLMKEQYSQTTTRVKEKLANKIKNAASITLELGKEALVFSSFTSFLGQILARFGAECCASIIGSHGKEIAFAPTDILELLNSVVSSEKDENLRNAEKQAFIEYISNPDEDLSDYLYSLAQSYFIIQILHIDPECQGCTRESLQKKKVYLDTNVIMHSLTGKSQRNKAVDTALKLTKDLGIAIVFSKRTKEEFMKLVDDSRRVFGKDPTAPSERVDKVYNQLEDGFLKDFLEKKKKNPKLTYERYADRLEEIEIVLKNRYSVTFDGDAHNIVLEHPDLPQLKQIVVDEGIPFGLFKTDFVAEHDAFHILLIQELRKTESGDVLGPNYWFLTHDRSLSFVEKKFGKEKIHSSIFLDNWVELISPLLAPEQTKDARDAYANLFASRLPLLTQTIKEEDFFVLQGKWIDDEDLTPEDVARIIGNRYIRDYLEEVREGKKEVNKEELERAIQPLIEEVKTGKKESQEMKKEIASLRKATTELQTKSTTLEQKIKTYEGILTQYQRIITAFGYFVSAVSFLALWYLLYQFILLRSLEPWQALIGATIVSLIFGYLAGFKGYKWLVDRVLKYALKR